jgi:hypothetical protein
LAFHLGREADHSPQSSAEVKEWVELCLHSPNTPSWRDAQLGGAQGLRLCIKWWHLWVGACSIMWPYNSAVLCQTVRIQFVLWCFIGSVLFGCQKHGW